MKEQDYKDIEKKFPEFARIWESAKKEFPDEGLKKSFSDLDIFWDFYHKMNKYFHDEEVRFELMFDICPKLQSLAKKEPTECIRDTIKWAQKVGWV